jgi:alkylhydroperoxidase family enzyme
VDLALRVKKAEDTNERLFAVAAWRDAPYFSDAERAALALAEAVTRLSDRPDPVPDEIWNEAARHYDERGLASLILWISMTNVWNRINVTNRWRANGQSRQTHRNGNKAARPPAERHSRSAVR